MKSSRGARRKPHLSLAYFRRPPTDRNFRPMTKIITPTHLKGRARKWFRSMVDAYLGFDSEPNAVSILEAAAEQIQRSDEYRKSIEARGLMIEDRFGQQRENPAAVGERAAANLHRLLCRELGLEPAAEENIRLPRVVGRAS